MWHPERRYPALQGTVTQLVSQQNPQKAILLVSPASCSTVLGIEEDRWILQARANASFIGVKVHSFLRSSAVWNAMVVKMYSASLRMDVLA